MAETNIILTLIIIFIVVAMLILLSAVRIIKAYEEGVYFLLGKYKRNLQPGWNMVVPLMSEVRRLDLRVRPLDVPRQEVITKDNAPTMVDAVVYFQVVDSKAAVLDVDNYVTATILMAQTTLRSIIGDMEVDEILSNREFINARLRDKLDMETDRWGVKVHNVEIREVEPSPAVKRAMEEQSSSERERRAQILRADGEKQSAVLRAEGQKQSRILAAEGIRQSRILEAQGERTAQILTKQGQAQGLRITAMGAASLDTKALTVLSLEALKSVGNGQATKIIFPFELSRLMEGASDYIGVSRKVPEREVTDQASLEHVLGPATDLLGQVPSVEEMAEELKEIKAQVKQVTATAERGGAMARTAHPLAPEE